ncbi:MAG TPA: GNAT family N-acetyltransferase [Pirellulaceae bacterium]|nr:GNAT family N-acetyltransferase [Pirellulaceae bacterium]
MNVFLADLANSNHQAAIIDLLDMYCRDEFGDGKPLAAEARARLIPGLVKHGGARVFLAYDGEQPLGVAICLVGFSSFRGKPLINIHDIAVSPNTRGKGVGRQLLAAVQAEASALGCCKVTLEVRSDNARAMGLYRSVGFKSSEPETYFWTQKVD